MNIAVCMKYVPADLSRGVDYKSAGIRRTPDNCAINQADMFALEAALRLKAQLAGKVRVFTMGPAFAENLLREACALGADELYLISDPALAGADSYATAAVLAAAVSKDNDLVLCGERTVDGETGQVPGELSARLDLPYASPVVEIIKASDTALVCRRLTGETDDIVQVPLPALLGISNGMKGAPRPVLPSLDGIRRAANMQYVHLGLDDLGMRACDTGAAGSPTRVEAVTVPDCTRRCVKVDDIGEALRLVEEVVCEQ